MTEKIVRTYWFYQTKCRICGEMESWMFCEVGQISNVNVLEGMQDYVDHPRLLDCQKCKIKTVQDVVSYGKKEL